MSFLVVKTIEDGKIFLSTVPSNWCDEKTLYFPKIGDWKTLRKKRMSPELDWKKYNCEIKGKYNTLEDALQAEKRLASFNDTEDEDRYFANLKENRAHPARILTTKCENMYNERLRELSTQQDYENSSSEVESSENDAADETLIQSFQPDDGHSETLSESVIFMDVPNYAKSIDELKGDMLKLHAKVDKILNILNNQVTIVSNTSMINSNLDTPDETIEDDMFPIKSVEALISLNQKLSDNIFFKSNIKKFNKEYIGTGYSWKKISYILIDKLIERQVLTSFTWTGSSKNQSKSSFSALINFNRFFYGIVKAGDQTYTQLNHEDFFKHSVLKYSDARATTAVKGLKRTSTPRVCVSRKKALIDLSSEEPMAVLQEDKENDEAI